MESKANEPGSEDPSEQALEETVFDSTSRPPRYEQNGFERALRWLFWTLAGVSVIYAITHRHWRDALPALGISALLVGATFLAMLYAEWTMYAKSEDYARAKNQFRWWRLLVSLLMASAVLLPVTAVLYSIGATLSDFSEWLMSQLNDQSKSAAVAVAVASVAGVFLFLVRLFYRVLYGLSEVFVGLLVAAHRVAFESSPSDSFTLYMAVLTAGVYLVVRGLDNVHQGWTANKDPAARWIRSRLGVSHVVK